MKNDKLIEPGKIVKKDNKLIRTKISVSNVTVGRMLANLIACININDVDLRTKFKIPVKDFILDFGNNYTHIKEVCRELVKATAEVEIPSKKGHPTFIVQPFFAKITYEQGIVEALFNPTMEEFLLNLKKCFTMYELDEYIALPSIYSQRIFELIKSWDGLVEYTVDIEDLYRWLNVPNSFKRNFKDFRLRVLEKAHKDILEHTCVRFEWEAIKKGNMVTAIRFILSKKRVQAIETEKKKIERQELQKERNFLGREALKCFFDIFCETGACPKKKPGRKVCAVCREMKLKERAVINSNIEK